MREIYGFLRLASRLANPFGHPSQVRTQVLVLQTCVDFVDLRVRLARALDLKRGAHKQCMQQRSNILTVSYLLVKRVCHLTGVGELTEATETN